ncbi:hypothetical protein BHMPCIPO_02828 [Ensifer sesbaniae]|nr:hypothetical protein [Ensifer sesbaniae]
MPNMPANRLGSTHGYFMAVCTRCERPSIFVLDVKGTATWEGVGQILTEYISGGPARNLSATNYDVTRFETTGKAPTIPEHLPADVEKAFVQAEGNYKMDGHEEAAATMYRRSLERALVATKPDLKGTLAAKIKSLVTAGEIPTALGDWAEEIRIVGNDGAHDDEVTRADLKAARMFCDAFLRYLITLPKEIELRRNQPS